MKTLVEKLAMARATRSVAVVIIIVTPACSITYQDLDVQLLTLSTCNKYQAHPFLEGQEHFLLCEILQGGHQGEHVINTKPFVDIIDKERKVMDVQSFGAL